MMAEEMTAAAPDLPETSHKETNAPIEQLHQSDDASLARSNCESALARSNSTDREVSPGREVTHPYDSLHLSADFEEDRYIGDESEIQLDDTEQTQNNTFTQGVDSADLFFNSVHLTDDEDEYDTSSTPAQDQELLTATNEQSVPESAGPNSDQISNNCESGKEEDLAKITCSNQRSIGTKDLEDEDQDMADNDEDDDIVEIIEDPSKGGITDKGLQAKDTNQQDIIDLTMDDDSEDDSPYIYQPMRTAVPALHIKSEPCDEDQVQDSTELNRFTPSQQGHFHDLPEIGNTSIPDGIEVKPEANQPNPGGIMNTTDMSNMLSTWNFNNSMISPNSAGYEPILEPEVDSDEEEIRAQLRFQKVKNAYESRRKRHALTVADRIEFDRAAKEEDARIRARKSRKQHEYDEYERIAQAESLFIPEREDSPSATAINHDANDNAANSYAPAARSSSPEQTSEQTPSGKTAKRGRPRGGNSKSAERKTAGKPRVSKKNSSTTAGGKRGKKQKEPAQINTNALLHHDIIAEAIANQGQASQPGFTSKNKKNALTELISSIPVEERNLYAGDKADLKKATENFNGKGSLKADGEGNWKLKGMKTSLRHYQLLGVSWMRSRENQLRNPRGGILSDDMGLGKTVSALANMVDGRPPLSQTGPTATLIVVPPTIMSQWIDEVDKHVEVFKKVMVYRSKTKFLNPESYLASHDVVITSYHEVMRSFPANNPPPELYTAQAKEEWWIKQMQENKGPLHQVYWHRIVLDEAQAIKNHLSKTSDAICHLRGRYRWCLSGTPIQNSLEEFYPFFRFLKCEHTGSFELFKRNFTKKGSDKALQRLQVYLGKIMLRRTHLDKLFGRPILKLPPIKPVQTIEVRFNAVERSIYHIVRQRFISRVKAFSKKDNAENNYQQILVLLLRLRQLVGHPLLIQKTLKDLLETEDLERLWDLTKSKNMPIDVDAKDTAPDDGLDTAQALHTALTLSNSPGSPLSFPGSGSQVVVSDNQLSTEFRKYLQSLRDDGSWGKANMRSLCAACGNPPSEPYITSCKHLYCIACLNDLQYSEFKKDKMAATCLACGQTISKNEAYAATAYNDAGNRRKSANRCSTPDEDIDWYTIGGPILRSAKVKGAVAQIKAWFEQDPTNKILVFTQFRGMIKVMERVCREEDNWKYASYHGAMSFDLRDEQIRKFSTDPEVRILLAAMKAGGVGLNLTAANRVIILDLWWNTCVESQAFTRCFRIGQTRDVEVVRFVVRDSIDTMIQEMQLRKITEIERAMEEKHRPRNLTTQELLELFSDGSTQHDKGKNGTDSQGFTGEDEPFVFPEDPHGSDGEDDDGDGDIVMGDAD